METPDGPPAASVFNVRAKFPAVRRALSAAAAATSLLLAGAAPTGRERVASYFSSWWPRISGTRIEATETRDVTVAGFSVYRVERTGQAQVDGRPRNQAALTLLDTAGKNVFTGEVLHDPQRAAAGRTFSASADLPNIQASLQEAYGSPVLIETRGDDRPPFVALDVRVREDRDAFASFRGLVSKDGATLLLGEFHPLAESPEAWRQKLLTENPGVRAAAGRFVVHEFLDFQCERCKRRTPEARDAARERGGALEAHFLPLVKSHDWAFAAAESGAALAAVDAALYGRYEELIFSRAEGMNREAARQLAIDAAEAAGVRARVDAEISSGRARGRVVRDIELASRLGITGTPAFVVDGRLVPGERGFLENELSRRTGP